VAEAETPDAAPRRAAKARSFVVDSLGARAQSVAEIRAKLAARDVPSALADEIVDEALRLGYLDDPELAGRLARGHRSRGYGRRRAATALRRRGIGAADAEAALAEAYGGDEAELAATALGTRPVGDDRERRRAVAFLVRRGFSSGVAWQVVRRRGDR
jgi:regulatory protein